MLSTNIPRFRALRCLMQKVLNTFFIFCHCYKQVRTGGTYRTLGGKINCNREACPQDSCGELQS